MGNRAIICFECDKYVKNAKTGQYRVKGKTIESYAIYLHWNGGPESIYAFLEVTNKRFEDRGNDHSYFAARFTETIGRFFGGNLSLGILSVPAKAVSAFNAKRADIIEAELSQGDNGVYVIGYDDKNQGFTVTRRVNEGKWLSDGEIQVERAHAYLDVKFAERVESIAAANVFPKEEAEAA